MIISRVKRSITRGFAAVGSRMSSIADPRLSIEPRAIPCRFVRSPRGHGRDPVDLVVEHIAQTLGKNQRENELLELRCILRAPDGAGGIPNPGFKRFARFFQHGKSGRSMNLSDYYTGDVGECRD